MKAVIQRVTRAAVHVDGQTVGQIESGLLILLGVAKGDGESTAGISSKRFALFEFFPMKTER